MFDDVFAISIHLKTINNISHVQESK